MASRTHDFLTLPRALLVDDNPDLRDALLHALRSLRANIQFESALDGAQALDIARRAHAEGKPYALVISDHHMPGLSGAELLATLERDQIIHAGILASASERAEADLRNLGSAAAFIRKPYRLDDLLRLVDRAVGA